MKKNPDIYTKLYRSGETRIKKNDMQSFTLSGEPLGNGSLLESIEECAENQKVIVSLTAMGKGGGKTARRATTLLHFHV